MTRKTAGAYSGLFEFVEKKLFNLEPTETMTDFEEGLRSAIKSRWPNASIKGCLWHFKRAIEKKCKSLGMHNLFKKNKVARKIKSMLMNVPLLPEHLLVDGYQSIKDFTHRNKLNKRFEEVFSYFEGYWLKQVYLSFKHRSFHSTITKTMPSVQYFRLKSLYSILRDNSHFLNSQ